MDSYLSISTGHAHANGDFQVADNDGGVTDALSAGDQRGGETALPLAKGVFGLAVQREGAADADLGAGGDGLGVGQSVFDRFGEPVSFDVGVVVPEGNHALDEVGAVLKGRIEDPAGVVAKPGRILVQDQYGERIGNPVALDLGKLRDIRRLAPDEVDVDVGGLHLQVGDLERVQSRDEFLALGAILLARGFHRLADGLHAEQDTGGIRLHLERGGVLFLLRQRAPPPAVRAGLGPWPGRRRAQTFPLSKTLSWFASAKKIGRDDPCPLSCRGRPGV